MNKKSIIFIVAVAIISIGLVVASQLSRRFPKNPEDTIGNNAGNLLNKGYVAEAGGKVYIRNCADGGTLWVMNPDESSAKRLKEITPEYINVGGDYLYYYNSDSGSSGFLSFMANNTGIYRLGIKGGNAECLQQSPVDYLLLVGNTLYYEYFASKHDGDPEDSGLGLYSIQTDRSDHTHLADTPVIPANYYNGKFYYAGQTADLSLHAYDPKSKNDSTVIKGSFWNPILSEGYVYYMNPERNYSICRRNLSGGNEEELVSDRTDCFNIVGNHIYYQKNSRTDPALMRAGKDGSNPTTVIAGNYTKINASSKYVYFVDYSNESLMYHQAIDGPVSPSVFNP
ncbi:MAG: DUF5050 domain-containing protein [Lachnospiraceae bacterium]|nr:DUF5050 domain-containing protein [Lachnospiraceae bacterium]